MNVAIIGSRNLRIEDFSAKPRVIDPEDAGETDEVLDATASVMKSRKRPRHLRRLHLIRHLLRKCHLLLKEKALALKVQQQKKSPHAVHAGILNTIAISRGCP